MATAFTIDGQIKVDIDKVINSKCEWYKYTHEEDDTSTVLELISTLNSSVINFIDKLPWKSWRTYDLGKWLKEDRIKNDIWSLYAECIKNYLKLSWRILTSHQDNLIKVKDISNEIYQIRT